MRFDGIERGTEEWRCRKWACGCGDGVKVHALNCKRGERRVASWFLGFYVLGFVVDEATRPDCLARILLAMRQAVPRANGLLASSTTRVLPSCGRTVCSVLSGAVGGNTGPFSDLGQIPGLSEGSPGASEARKTIFVVVASAC